VFHGPEEDLLVITNQRPVVRGRPALISHISSATLLSLLTEAGQVHRWLLQKEHLY